jgi:hypothetical protein
MVAEGVITSAQISPTAKLSTVPRSVITVGHPETRFIGPRKAKEGYMQDKAFDLSPKESFSEGNHDEKGKINAGNAPKWG